VEDYILNTLKSIVSQTYQKIELILVDDGSPDQSIEIAERYLSDKKINWRVIHKENAGLSAARNTGIENANGEYVICPDSDDYIEPDTIEKMVQCAEEKELSCVFCGYKSVSINNISLCNTSAANISIYNANVLRKLFLERKLRLLVPGMLVRRTIYDKIKFDPLCPYDEDIHFLWRLLFLEDSYGYIDNPYYHYLSRESSMVHTLSPHNYLGASKAYALMVKELAREYPDDIAIINKIYPKYRLGGLHVLSKSNDFKTFKDTVIQDGYRKDMLQLIFQPNIKLSLYATIYCISLRMFYSISRR
jgi:glycosyltransferase involved in cell wall biosynthesis